LQKLRLIITQNMERKLRLSNDDRKIGGVCGGLAKFLGLDSTLVRVAIALLTFVGGMSLLVYLIMWMIIPRE
jgi:phage shock protein PspC (stress-responsive transcriptional regulator)